ncbi:MAG: hypothetical protein H3C68_08170 [Deltaproteobacteria bacterium]|nr:hypothetical protein [Deltaproteobacteria bacterium]MBZ0219343.1 hypothetical protein [Deltaproteobacteria bacterium]
MRQQFLLNTPDRFQTYIYESNRRLVPEAAFITVYTPEGRLLVERAQMSIAGDGLLLYDLGQAENSVAALNYKAVIEYAHASKTHYATLLYDVVKSRLGKVVTDDDLTAELPQLRESNWSVRGLAESGSETAIIDTGLKRYGDDYFTGGTAYLPAKGERREVTGFTAASGTVSVEPFPSPVLSGESYILSRSFGREIQRAFEKLEERLTRLGKRPHLVLDSYDLREAHIFLSVAEACKGLAAESKGLWWDFWKEYERKADEAISEVTLKYDRTGDGLISGAEGSYKFNTLKAGRR